MVASGMLSVVSLGPDCPTTTQQGSRRTRGCPERPTNVLGRRTGHVVRDSPEQSAPRLRTEWGTSMASPMFSAKNYGIAANMRGFRSEPHGLPHGLASHPAGGSRAVRSRSISTPGVRPADVNATGPL